MVSNTAPREPDIADLQTSADAAPHDAAAWRALADACFHAGRIDEADAAYQRYILASVNDPRLRDAAIALAENRLDIAERLLKPHLKLYPTDVVAIRMLAELAGRIGRNGDAEALLSRALALAPGFAAARQNYAMLLHRLDRSVEALEQVNLLLSQDAANPAYLNLKGVILAKIGDYADAIDQFEAVLKQRPGQPGIWMSFGHSLKTVGRQKDSISAYRQSIALQPTSGEAWWSLANLKTVRFSDDDIAAMTDALRVAGLTQDDRFHLHFALGKALEDRKSYAASFEYYAEGNRLRAGQLGYDPEIITRLVDTSIGQFTPQFFAERMACGDKRSDPIFVLGMPRSGSTLVEQILASHPLIEGTRELPNIQSLARQTERNGTLYPASIENVDFAQFAALGSVYLDGTRVHRKHGTPYFIDKMPNNWAYIPLIHLMFPNAKIIDTRRDAMACAFSNFKQHFARGQAFSYDLTHLGRYYSDYVRLMAHMNAVLPGRVHLIAHEQLVDNTEHEVRRLLDYLGLPFDPACLRFWEHDRSVQTASSEQVRRPINRDGIDQWQAFDPFLTELKAALCDNVDTPR